MVGGNLDLDWALGRPFSVSGAIDVEEALLAFGFGQSSANGSQTPDTSLVFDIRVRGERDIWLRNQLVDIEFSGDLAVRKTLTDLLLSGELVSRQGTVYYLDHALRVTTGAIRFENVSTLNPDLNLTAEMPIRVTAGAPNTPDKVVLALTGTLEQPSFTFRTEPPNWDELEIVSYLTLNLTPDQITAPEMKDNVTKLLGSRLLGYFQNQVAKRARGFANLDYLEFESGFLGSKESRVRVGKYVGRNLYVSYTQNFTGDMSPLFRVEYYLNRKNEILAEGSTGNRYSLRYQLRFRY
ncbi:hypothetical protein FJY70_05875 [candidate division WOR-3 bacterium]|nr:hypothetical protein [candidate division WOR-3 bacterium]